MMQKDLGSDRTQDLLPIYITNKCSRTGLTWIRIYATRRIKEGGEIFIDYGEDFWKSSGSHDAMSTMPMRAATACSVTQENSSSSLWAASAPMPDRTPSQISQNTNLSRVRHTMDDVSTAHRQNMIEMWANQVIAPAIPMIIGHHRSTDTPHTPTPIHFPTQISPIKSQIPTNPHTYE